MNRPGRVVGAILGVAALGMLLVALPAATHVSVADVDAEGLAGGLSQAMSAAPLAADQSSPQDQLPTPDSAAPTQTPTSTSAPTSTPASAPNPASAPIAADARAAIAPTLTPVAPASAAPAPPPAAESADTAQLRSAAPAAPVVVAIGDSIMSGHGLDDPSGSWPQLLADRNGWQLTNLADDGTGFVQPGDNDDTFQDQVAIAVQLDPSIVIIAASNNDLGVDSSELADQTNSTLQSLRAALPEAQIIALSAFWGDETPPDELQEATDDIHSAADTVGAAFVDIGQPLAGRADLMQDDDVHPTADGQELLATVIGSDISGALAGS
ncbi:SGNH/GDSL hydrolase family protein [Subtercola boreus]|nr:SGNH/GDSL hydrolase family protein [Subtercola boreus]